jgi:hypothetical protein
MNIAIIGGGWIGCHLTYKLKKKHKVTIFDKNPKLFQETSFKNQNRLHLGYHYARSFETRKMCKNTFKKFLKDYKFLTKNINKNYYCIPKNNSILDFKTFSKIFNIKNKDLVNEFENTFEGCIKTNEKYINFTLASKFFNKELKENFVNREVFETDFEILSKEYDLVINCTNNFLIPNTLNNFYELTLSLIYKKNKKIPFDALTLIDGKLFSIFPYKKNKVSLTDVEFTPIKKFETINDLLIFSKNTNEDFYLERVNLFEKKVMEYYPTFKSDFSFDGFFLSVKSKIISESDSRFPQITIHDNVVNCFSGKIQGIYIIEDYIKKLIKNEYNIR